MHTYINNNAKLITDKQTNSTKNTVKSGKITTLGKKWINSCLTLIFEILSTFHTFKALRVKWVTLDTHEHTTAITTFIF